MCEWYLETNDINIRIIKDSQVIYLITLQEIQDTNVKNFK